ncbi:proline-rich protein 2-like [Aquila chrysaetos chrysaetos]|uniref:proline-rich protein 2-like n=1 Tax=Aquila chrysaetos chrysaetos TaxID=223781 RepID=UPI00117726BD|nr:proline-rich protein 2-like [Aquila chrysaetos chrysaetos]
MRGGGAGRRRDTNENGAGKAAGSDRRCVGVRPEPPARGRARAGTAAARGGLGPEGEAGRSSPGGAAGRDSGGRDRPRLCRAVPPATGGGPRTPSPRGRRRCGGPSRPAGPTGSRSGARARAALHAPEVNGRSCLGAPRALGQGGPLAHGPPPPQQPEHTTPTPPPGPGPAPVSRGSARTRGRLRPGEGVCRCGKPRFRPFDPKSAPRPPDLRSPRPYLCDELLGAQRDAAGQSARLPPRFSLCGGFHGCELCNENRGATASPAAARGGGGASTRVRARLSRGRRRGGRELAPTQPPARSIPAPQPGSSPRLPVRSGDRASQAAPPHGHPCPGRLGSSPAPGTARFPGRPKVPVPVGDPVTPRSPPRPTTVSPSPGRPEHGPNAETAGGSGGRASRPPRQSPSAC